MRTNLATRFCSKNVYIFAFAILPLSFFWTICLNTVYLYYIVIFLRNSLFQTLIRVLIYANKETSLQQYFALKMYTFSYSSYPLYPSFDKLNACNLLKQYIFRNTINCVCFCSLLHLRNVPKHKI